MLCKCFVEVGEGHVVEFVGGGVDTQDVAGHG